MPAVNGQTGAGPDAPARSGGRPADGRPGRCPEPQGAGQGAIPRDRRLASDGDCPGGREAPALGGAGAGRCVTGHIGPGANPGGSARHPGTGSTPPAPPALTPAHLVLIQWLSAAFPTGAYAYSHGLEQALAQGTVRDGLGFEVWLANVLRFGAGRQDAVILALGLAPGADHAALDALARALQVAAERVQESAEQGAALARTVAGITGRHLPPRLLPVALAEAAAPLALPPADVTRLYLQGFAANLCTIATRHIPLGQTLGQAALTRLLPLIDDLGRQAATAGPDDLWSTAPGAELAAMAHETLDVRIFRT